MPLRMEYRHNLDECEAAVRSVAHILAVGNYEGAMLRLETVVQELKGGGTVDGRLPVTSVFSLRITNLLDERFNIMFCDQLPKISYSQLLDLRSVSIVIADKIRSVASEQGFPLRDEIAELKNN